VSWSEWGGVVEGKEEEGRRGRVRGGMREWKVHTHKGFAFGRGPSKQKLPRNTMRKEGKRGLTPETIRNYRAQGKKRLS